MSRAGFRLVKQMAGRYERRPPDGKEWEPTSSMAVNSAFGKEGAAELRKGNTLLSERGWRYRYVPEPGPAGGSRSGPPGS